MMKRFIVLIIGFILAGLLLGLAQGAGETTTLQAWVNSVNTWMVSAKASIAGFSTKDAAQDGRLTAAEKAAVDLAAANALQDKRLTAAEGALSTLQAQIATLITPPPPPPPLPPPPPVATLIWSAGMEAGNLTEWPVQNNNTGPALSSAVRAAAEGIPARTPWVMKQEVTVNGSATRMGADIVALVRAGTPFWVTWWDYYPQPIRFGPSDQFMFFQIAGFDGVNYNPVWGFYLNGADGTPVIIWSPNDKAPAEGPHATEAGKRTYTTTIPVPIGKWVLFELYEDASANFLGALQLYMDGVKLFDQSQIKTRYPGTGAPNVAGYSYHEHTAYGAVGKHYVDDVTISLQRTAPLAFLPAISLVPLVEQRAPTILPPLGTAPPTDAVPPGTPATGTAALGTAPTGTMTLGTPAPAGGPVLGVPPTPGSPPP